MIFCVCAGCWVFLVLLARDWLGGRYAIMRREEGARGRITLLHSRYGVVTYCYTMKACVVRICSCVPTQAGVVFITVYAPCCACSCAYSSGYACCTNSVTSSCVCGLFSSIASSKSFTLSYPVLFFMSPLIIRMNCAAVALLNGT